MHNEKRLRTTFAPCLSPRVARHLSAHSLVGKTGSVIPVSAPGHCNSCGAPDSGFNNRLSHIRLQTPDTDLSGGSS